MFGLPLWVTRFSWFWDIPRSRRTLAEAEYTRIRAEARVSPDAPATPLHGDQSTECTWSAMLAAEGSLPLEAPGRSSLSGSRDQKRQSRGRTATSCHITRATSCLFAGARHRMTSDNMVIATDPYRDRSPESECRSQLSRF